MHLPINRKTVGATFFAALTVLVFFSRTVYTHSLPRVTAVSPQNGRLHKRETATGIADWAEIERLYAAVGGVVEELLVREGDAVHAGQELLHLRFDRDGAEHRLRELAGSRSRLQTEIQAIELNIQKTRRYMEQLEDEEYEEETVSAYEREALALRIRQARQKLRDARERQSWGEAEDSEVREIQHTLDGLYLEEAEMARRLAEDREKAHKAVEDSERERKRRLEDYETELSAYALDLAVKSLDLRDIELQEEPYRKALAEFDTHTVLTAPAAGTVLELPLHRGEAAAENSLLAAVGVGEAFLLECSVPLENTFVRVGDGCKLKNAGHTVEGEVSSIQPGEEGGKTVQVRFASGEITAGESFDVTFERQSDTTYTLVPNSAVHRDNDGYFVYQVKRREGILGEEYYLERLGVYIGDADADNTVITQGIAFFEPVANMTDKPVSAGQTIVLTNEGDFYHA